MTGGADGALEMTNEAAERKRAERMSTRAAIFLIRKLNIEFLTKFRNVNDQKLYEDLWIEEAIAMRHNWSSDRVLLFP